MAGWPLFVYPKYFCSQNKPAERRSHPLLVVMGGTIDLGRFAYYYVSVSDGVSAGGRFASYHPPTAATLASYNTLTRQAVLDGMQGVTGFDQGRVTIPDPVITTDPAPFAFQRVNVQAQYDFRTIFAWPLVPSQITISRSVVMRMVR